MSRKKKSNNSSSNNNSGSGASNGTPFGPVPPSAARTVNVSADGGPPQAMTPEAAAKYLQQATASSNNREVKISFGPSRPPPSRNSGSNHGHRPPGMSLASLDLQALKAAAAAQRSVGGSGATGPSVEGMPCSEAEMKALMGMFVEIMGMNMDGNGNPNSSGAKNGKKSSQQQQQQQNNPFAFGGSFASSMTNSGASPPYWPDQESLAAATAGIFTDGASWEALRRTYGAVYNNMNGGNGSGAYFGTSGYGDYDEEDDDEDYDDDDDENESIPELDCTPDGSTSGGGRRGPSERRPIAPGDWESLEKVAVEDALEAEERARKAAKKREKKQRRKQKQKEEAAAKAADAAQKKREKAILSWRSRVVSACQSGETPKLEALLQESPLTATSSDDEGDLDLGARLAHLEFLLPNTLAKNRSYLERGKDTRQKLAAYILSMELRLAFLPLRTGRTAFHTACFHGDVTFVECVLTQLQECLDEYSSPLNAAKAVLSTDDLNMTCSDSGWTPLHYAAVSGSMEVLEILLRAGCNVETISDDTHTWRDSDGVGVTPRELVECIHAGSYDNVLESHGVALQEMENIFFGTQSDRQSLLRTLDKVAKRLREVEVNGYVAPGLLERSSSFTSDDGVLNQDGEPLESAAAAKKRRKKKKKKKPAMKEESVEDPDNESDDGPIEKASSFLSAAKETPVEDFEDPLFTALLGMGFAKDQISAAVCACGGTSRATADDLVTWILGQDADGGTLEETNIPSTNGQSTTQPGTVEVNEKTVVKKKTTEEAKRAAEEENRRKVEAAKRLAEKREEQRRRNREWNNREQARQQQQTKVKVTAGAAAQAAAPKPPGYAAFPVLNGSTTPPGLQTGLLAAATANNTLQTGVPPMTIAPALVHPPAAKSTSKVGPNVTLLKKPIPAQTVTNPIPTKPAPATARAVPASYTISHLSPAIATQASVPKPRAPPVAAPPPMTAQNSFPPIGDDDRTVSSFGSNRGLSVSSAAFIPPGSANYSSISTASSFAPPGFMQAVPPGIGQPISTLPLTEEEKDAHYASHLGEIRATAKEFVPKGYTPPPIAQPRIQEPISSVPPPISKTFVPGLGAPLNAGPVREVPSSIENSALPFSHGFLRSAGPPPPTTSSFLGGGVNPYDGLPSLTPASEDTSTTTPSIGSTLAGVPGLDDSTLSAGLGSLGFAMDSQPASGTASSLLTSAFTTGPPIGVDSIWGGGNSSSQTAPSLTGLAGLHFGVAGRVEDSKNKNGEPLGKNHLTSTWGAPSVGGGSTTSNHGGSIW